MKPTSFISLLLTVLLLTGAPNVFAYSGKTSGKVDLCKQERVQKDPELALRLGCPTGKPATSGAAAGAQGSGTPGSAGSGSSEHGSIKGTINGGGDFIAPKLKEPAPRPKRLAPKAR